MPITAIRKACQSDSRHCLSCSIEQGNLWDSNVDQSGFGARKNTYSAHNKFSENILAEKMVDRTRKPVGESSSSAQIRTLLDEQRQIIIEEYCEKVSHHELLAARAEEERQFLQEIWRQQQDFREAHQKSLIEMEESRKFKSSTFDTLTRQKFIEDQNTILELSGRVQELQNEVNCMNDSQEFQDAESARSGNSHVTSPPGLFPRHPPYEGLLQPAFISQRQTEEPPNIWDTHGCSGNVFANPHASSSAPYPQELNSPWKKTIEEPTLGKLLTEAHREYSDHRSPEGVSVSQSSLSVVFDRTGKLVGERNVDQFIGFGVTRNT